MEKFVKQAQEYLQETVDRGGNYTTHTDLMQGVFKSYFIKNFKLDPSTDVVLDGKQIIVDNVPIWDCIKNVPIEYVDEEKEAAKSIALSNKLLRLNRSVSKQTRIIKNCTNDIDLLQQRLKQIDEEFRIKLMQEKSKINNQIDALEDKKERAEEHLANSHAQLELLPCK